MLDAAAKTPPAFIESTVASFGDYDECLAVKGTDNDGNDINGAYCMVDLFASGKRTGYHDENINFANVHAFERSPTYFGHCMPSQCSPHDVKQLVSDGE